MNMFTFFRLTRTKRIYFQDSKAVVWLKRRKQLSGPGTGKETFVKLYTWLGMQLVNFVIRGRNEKLMKFSISTKRISADTSFRVVSKQILFGLIFKTFPCVYLFKIIWEIVPK